MATPRNAAVSDMTRVWLMEDGAGPTTTPEYMGVWKAGAISKDYGESTAIEIPSDSKYQGFEEVASVKGAAGKPSMQFTARYTRSLSDMLRIAERECYHDFQVFVGACGDLQNRTSGWDKIVVLEYASVSSYGTDDLGALSSDERAAVNENINIQATRLYEIGKLSFAEVAASTVIQEVVDITVCDAKSCGECGETSDGCQKVFGLVKAVGGSPGLGGQVVYSDDAGSTWGSTVIDTLAANEEPSAISCYGEDIIVVSNDGAGHSYADRDDILLGTETWVEVTTGYAGGGEPNDLFVLKPGYCWIVGDGGYIYKLENVADAPTVQDAGAATAQNLNAVHAYDEENVLAVGDSNAVVHTTDGSTWSAVTGPAVGVNLNCCWMVTKTIWWVGTAGGELWYTLNSGATWTQKAFTGSGAGQVRDILFISKQVGYLAHDTATPRARILRTIDGGYSWYVMPDSGSMPTADRFNALAGCDNVNLVFAGGLADDASDGIIVKGSA